MKERTVYIGPGGVDGASVDMALEKVGVGEDHLIVEALNIGEQWSRHGHARDFTAA